MNLFEQTGITIEVFSPVKQGSKYISTIQNYNGYSHSISAFGGYDEASFEMKVNLDDATEWFRFGIGREIRVYDEAAGLVWNGIANEINLQYGNRSITVGPFLDIANRVAVLYSPLIQGFSPPSYGDTTLTSFYSENLSISLYGIMQLIVNGGQRKDDTAIQLANSWLIDSAFPRRSESLSESGSDLLVRVSCVGFYRLFEKYYYSNLSGGNQTYSNRVTAVVAAEPNSIFNSSTKRIETNGNLIEAYSDYSTSAIDTLRTVVGNGDSSFNRWLLGIYEDKICYYNPVPLTPEYKYSISRGVNSLSYAESDQMIRPWQLRPGKWLRYTDFTLGISGDSIYTDPNCVFIEQVRYSAPFKFSIQGGKAYMMGQKLAKKYGIGGS